MIAESIKATLRYSWVSLILFGLAVGIAHAGAQTDWKQFTSPEGRFTVRMPGTPTEEAQPARPVDATPPTHTFFLERKGTAFFVSWTDFPPEQVAGKDPSVLLTGARNGAVANVKGKLISDKEISVSGSPGRDILASVPLDKKQGSAHFYVVLANSRLYSVVYIATAGSGSDSEGTSFLKSFQISAEESEDGWKQFTSKDGHFSIRVPGIPAEQTSSAPGGVKIHQFVLDQGSRAYIIAYNGIGSGAPDAASIPTLLNKGRDAILANGHGKLLEEKSISLAGLPGKSIRVTMPEAKGVAIVNSYVVDDQYYQVMLIGSTKALESANAARYFGSFQLTASKGSSTAAEDWKTFHSKDGRFAIDLPGDPKLETLANNVKKLVSRPGADQYFVVYTDLAGEVTGEDKIAALLERLKETELKAISATELTKKTIKLGESPGVQMTFSVPASVQTGGGTGIERFYLVGSRIYELGVITRKTTIDEQAFARFFDSFNSITPKPGP